MGDVGALRAEVERLLATFVELGLVPEAASSLLLPLLLQPALRAAQVDDIRKLSAGGVLYGKVLGAGLDFLVVALLVFAFAKLVLKEQSVAKK